MLKLRLFFLAFCLCVLSACAAHAAPFVSAKGYAVTPAPGWAVSKSGMMGTDVIFYTRAAGGFAPNFNVLIATASPGETLAQTRTGIGAMYPKLFSRYKMVKMTDDMVGGIPALLVVGTYQQNGRQLSLRQDIVIKNGKVYTFTGTVPAAAGPRYTPLFAQMIHSVRWSTH